MSFPYPVNGKTYDTDSTTVLANVKVICRNVTTNENQSMLTNSLGEFTFDLANFTSGYTVGDEISLFASYGLYCTEEIFTTDATYSKTQNLTLDTEIETVALYTFVTAVRRYTAVNSSEYSNDAVYDMIKQVTGRIDELTGKTWKGIQTVTDEYYDGDDTDMLWLNNTDIQSVTSLAIDDNQDGTYTTVSTSYVKVYNEGYIILDRNSNITSFVAYPKSVKISYTHGNSKPTETVKELALLMVANLMHNDPMRIKLIDQLLNKLKWKGPQGLC